MATDSIDLLPPPWLEEFPLSKQCFEDLKVSATSVRLPQTVAEYQEHLSLDEADVKSYENAITHLVDIYRGLHDQAIHYREHTVVLIVDVVQPFVLHGNEAQLYYGAFYTAIAALSEKSSDSQPEPEVTSTDTYDLAPQDIAEIVIERIYDRFSTIRKNAKDAITDLEIFQRDVEGLKSRLEAEEFSIEEKKERQDDKDQKISEVASSAVMARAAKTRAQVKRITALQKDLVIDKIGAMIEHTAEAIEVLEGVEKDIVKLLERYNTMKERVEGKETIPPEYLVSDQREVIVQWEKMGEAVEEYMKSAYKFNDEAD